jgi:hypothetical protein
MAPASRRKIARGQYRSDSHTRQRSQRVAEVCAMVFAKWIYRVLLNIAWAMSGVLSISREIYGLYKGTLPPVTLFWECTWSAFILSSFLVWLEEHRNVLSLRREIQTLKEAPASLEARMRELYRKQQGNQHGDSVFDLFLRVRLELKLPEQVQVKNCRFELFLHGVVEAMERVDDLSEWEITTWDSKPGGAGITSFPVTPLAVNLQRSEPVEGWLHFVTKPTTEAMLDKCALRLIVQTSRGSTYAEHEAEPAIWNPQRLSISRRLGGRLWQP